MLNRKDNNTAQRYQHAGDLQDRCETLELQTPSPAPKSSFGNINYFDLKGENIFSLLLCLMLS